MKEKVQGEGAEIYICQVCKALFFCLQGPGYIWDNKYTGGYIVELDWWYKPSTVQQSASREMSLWIGRKPFFVPRSLYHDLHMNYHCYSPFYNKLHWYRRAKPKKMQSHIIGSVEK